MRIHYKKQGGKSLQHLVWSIQIITVSRLAKCDYMWGEMLF